MTIAKNCKITRQRMSFWESAELPPRNMLKSPIARTTATAATAKGAAQSTRSSMIKPKKRQDLRAGSINNLERAHRNIDVKTLERIVGKEKSINFA